MRCDGGMAYELAHQLEAGACWRPWLGDQWYAELRQHLGSAAAWATLMRSDASTSPSRLRLQLRISALLYDRALESVLSSGAPLNSASSSLQANGVYFSLEHDAQDWARLQAERAPMLAAIQAKYGLDPRDFLLSHHVADNKVRLQQRRVVPAAPKQGRNFLRTTDQSKSFGRTPSGIRTLMDKDGEELDLWYDQWLGKRLVERMHCLARRFAQQKLAFGERDSFRRTPEGMATFINLSTRSWLRQHDETLSTQEPSGFAEEDLAILPETLLANCVPHNSCPGRRAYDECSICYFRQSSSARSSTLLPGLSSHGVQKQGTVLTTAKAVLVKEEADRLTQRTLAKILDTIGFEGAKQTTMDVLSELMVCYMRNLGNRLRMLLDSYQKHLTTDEVLRMFVRCAGGSLANLRSLDDYVRSEKANSSASQVQQNEQFVNNKMQMNLAYQQALKEKQLAAARAARLDFSSGPMEMKSFVSTFAPNKAWMGQQQQSPLQLPHSNPQALQQLKQALHLQQTSGMSGLTKTRIEGLQEILGSDLVKQEASDDMDGTLGSPNKRKRGKND